MGRVLVSVVLLISGVCLALWATFWSYPLGGAEFLAAPIDPYELWEVGRRAPDG
jgi:hypothetical protein